MLPDQNIEFFHKTSFVFLGYKLVLLPDDKRRDVVCIT